MRFRLAIGPCDNEVMLERPKKKRPRDVNQLAKMVAGIATGDIDDNENEKPTRGRAGGLVGGRARAEKLSAAERRAIAKMAAATRWAARKNH